MSSIHVRGATLDDTLAISSLFRDRIAVWQRLNTAAQVEDVPYESLTIYERWQHGGPWMSVETAAIHLSHLLRGAGIPLVGEADGQIVAYAETYRGAEPDPYSDHLHLAQLVIDPEHRIGNIPDVMLSDVLDQARVARCFRLTADCVASDIEAQTLYTRHGLNVISRISRYTLPARSGQGFYKVVEHTSESAQQMAGWFMSVGRLGSARQQWETLWPRTWDAITDIRERPSYRLHFSASGQEALIYCQQQLYQPRAIDVYLWSPKPLTSQLLTALRDWTYREGYRTLVLAVTEDTAKILGSEAEADGFYVDVYGVRV